MARFSIGRFMPPSNPRVGLDVFTAKFRNLRYLVRTDRVIVVDASMAANLPGLAHTYLGDRFLWWVLLYFNGLQDPVNDVIPGLELRIPKKEDVIAVLETSQAADSSALTRV